MYSNGRPPIPARTGRPRTARQRGRRAPRSAGRSPCNACSRPAARRAAGPATGSRPLLRRGRSRSGCVVNGRLRHAGKNTSRRAPPCVISRVLFYILHTSTRWARRRARRADRGLSRGDPGERTLPHIACRVFQPNQGSARGSRRRSTSGTRPKASGLVVRPLSAHHPADRSHPQLSPPSARQLALLAPASAASEICSKCPVV